MKVHLTSTYEYFANAGPTYLHDLCSTYWINKPKYHLDQDPTTTDNVWRNKQLLFFKSVGSDPCSTLPVNTRPCPNVVLILCLRLRRRHNIKTTLGQRLVLPGDCSPCVLCEGRAEFLLYKQSPQVASITLQLLCFAKKQKKESICSLLM